MKTIFSSISFAALLLIAFSSCKNESTDKSEEFAINEIVQPEFTEINSETETKGYTIGDEATDFKLKDVNGKMVSLSDYKGAKGFIVIFTCNTCPYAVASEERMVDNVRNASEVKERFLANAVNELLAGKEISVKETKAIGCSVKQ